MSQYGLTQWAYFFDAPEDRAAAEAWTLKSKCLGFDPEFFVPPAPTAAKGTPEYREQDTENKNQTKAAKRFCKGQEDGRPCPVMDECLAYALENKVWEGVYGGTSARERRKIDARRRKAAASSTG